MRKAFLIGVIVCVLAMSGIGAAFATTMEFTEVGELSLGHTGVSQVDCDYIGYELDTGFHLPVEVNGVYISFNKDLHSTVNSTIIFVSLRNASFQELAYCVAVVPASTTLYATNVYKIQTADGTFADPEAVYYVKVTVAENSTYSTLGGGQDYGAGTVYQMPGTAP